jgi:hypothetical protein
LHLDKVLASLLHGDRAAINSAHMTTSAAAAAAAPDPADSFFVGILPKAGSACNIALSVAALQQSHLERWMSGLSRTPGKRV